jgi:hypothetical protein
VLGETRERLYDDTTVRRYDGTRGEGRIDGTAVQSKLTTNLLFYKYEAERRNFKTIKREGEI